MFPTKQTNHKLFQLYRPIAFGGDPPYRKVPGGEAPPNPPLFSFLPPLQGIKVLRYFLYTSMCPFLRLDNDISFGHSRVRIATMAVLRSYRIYRRARTATTVVFVIDPCALQPVTGLIIIEASVGANNNGAWHSAFWRSRPPHTQQQGSRARSRMWESRNPREGSRRRMWRSRWLSRSRRTSTTTYAYSELAKYARRR